MAKTRKKPTAAEKIEIEENKFHRYRMNGSVCMVCKKETAYDKIQIAHMVPKGYESIHGPEVIHHDKNTSLVCSLKCNQKVLLNPATHPIECDALIAEIEADLELKDAMEGRR